MSWNDYITNLVGTNAVEKATIAGINGAIWASSSSWNVTPAEITAIASKWPDFSSTGIKLGATKFMFLRGDDQVVLARDKNTGVVIAKTKSAFVIGYHNDKQQFGNANKEVLKIADYLSEQGY